MGTLSGKVAWITGAGTGIGLAGAQALAEAGATVVMSGRRKEILAAEAQRIRDNGAVAEIEVLDVADPEAVKRVADAVLARHGQVDILLNSAGLNSTGRASGRARRSKVGARSSASTSTEASTPSTPCCRRCGPGRTG